MPWIAVFILSLPGKLTRASLLALTVAVGFTAFILYAYLTSTANPHLWIGWSASRVLITPLVCLFFFAAARVTAVGSAPVSSPSKATLGTLRGTGSLEAILEGNGSSR